MNSSRAEAIREKDMRRSPCRVTSDQGRSLSQIAQARTRTGTLRPWPPGAKESDGPRQPFPPSSLFALDSTHGLLDALGRGQYTQKAERAGVGDGLPVRKDRELTVPSAHQLYLNTEVSLERLRHTGGVDAGDSVD